MKIDELNKILQCASDSAEIIILGVSDNGRYFAYNIEQVHYRNDALIKKDGASAKLFITFSIDRPDVHGDAIIHNHANGGKDENN